MTNNYINGSLEGIRKEYYESGSLKLEETYRNNQLNGAFIKYSEGYEIKSEGNYTNGKLDESLRKKTLKVIINIVVIGLMLFYLALKLKN